MLTKKYLRRVPQGKSLRLLIEDKSLRKAPKGKSCGNILRENCMNRFPKQKLLRISLRDKYHQNNSERKTTKEAHQGNTDRMFEEIPK